MLWEPSSQRRSEDELRSYLMCSIKIVDDIVVLEVDAAFETPSEMFGCLTRAGTLCRQHNLTKGLYLRSGPPTDPITVTQLIGVLPTLGFGGCDIAMVVSSSTAAYSLTYLEQLAAQFGIRLLICESREHAMIFLRHGVRSPPAARAH